MQHRPHYFNRRIYFCYKWYLAILAECSCKQICTADPAVYISDEVRYTDQGNNIPISAAIYSSNLNALSVEWYHEDTLQQITLAIQ